MRVKSRIFSFVDFFLSPVVYPAGWVLEFVRRVGVDRLPICRKALIRIGVFPIRNHYYEPQFDFQQTIQPFSQDRDLPGIEWNIDEQLGLLDQLTYASEIAKLPRHKTEQTEFHMENGTFESGDAEFWYQLIREKKPKRIIEIGSGSSTLIGVRALQKNHEEDPDYNCRLTCIEPFEMPWLESLGLDVVRMPLESLDVSFFSELGADDILFIDSSHVIRPEGDVVYEYLKLLPTLRPGVIVHIHDIFSPKNYPSEWLVDMVRFWNEQYLLEAFLTDNKNWKIVGALNYLRHHHFENLKAVAPFLTEESEPGSFYIQRAL